MTLPSPAPAGDDPYSHLLLFHVSGIGHTLLHIKLESELSTLLDYEEIAVQGPAIGIGGFGRV